MSEEILTMSAEDRLELVLDRTFRGLHHCPKNHKKGATPHIYWEVNPTSGIVSDEKEKDDWNEQFAKLIDETDDETVLTVVDCHI